MFPFGDLIIECFFMPNYMAVDIKINANTKMTNKIKFKQLETWIKFGSACLLSNSFNQSIILEKLNVFEISSYIIVSRCEKKTLL